MKNYEMNENEFWKIIDSVKEKKCDERDYIKLLKEYDNNSILLFKHIFNEYSYKLNDIEEKVGNILDIYDDHFIDFKSWAISMGEDFYNQLINDTDNTLKGLTSKNKNSIQFESFAYIAYEAYASNDETEFYELMYNLNVEKTDNGYRVTFKDNIGGRV